jgi:serine/threonine protein kinase
MAFKVADAAMEGFAAPHADPVKLEGSTAYAAPELVRKSTLSRAMRNHPAGGATRRWSMTASTGGSPYAGFQDARGVDLWSFAATLYEMATSVPLFPHRYDRITPASREELLQWGGLTVPQIEVLEEQHARAEAASLVDLLRWSLDADPANRPASIDDVLKHAFFNPESGSLREDFTMQRIRELLESNKGERDCCSVMISYCWANSDFVLGKLAPELALRCSSLWLDRLGGENGMGEWAVESMQRGVDGADIVVAVVSPDYIKSGNCGKEMGMAASTGTVVLPIVLGVPFSEWPPQRIGQTPMSDQFIRTDSGDMKIFVDMTDQSLFHTKMQRELIPRLLMQGVPRRASLSAVPSLVPAISMAAAGTEASDVSDAFTSIV